MGWWKRLPWWTRSLSLLLFAWTVLSAGCQDRPSDVLLVIRDQEHTEQIYWMKNVHPGDEIQISWTHSIEKSTWMDTLTVSEDGRLYLDETRFRSFGAGMPYATEGNITFKDGYIIMSELQQPMPAYRWVHSHRVEHTVRLNGEVVLQPKDIPHHRPAELLILGHLSMRPRPVPAIRPITDPNPPDGAKPQEAP